MSSACKQPLGLRPQSNFDRTLCPVPALVPENLQKIYVRATLEQQLTLQFSRIASVASVWGARKAPHFFGYPFHFSQPLRHARFWASFLRTIARNLEPPPQPNHRPAGQTRRSSSSCLSRAQWLGRVPSLLNSLCGLRDCAPSPATAR